LKVVQAICCHYDERTSGDLWKNSPVSPSAGGAAKLEKDNEMAKGARTIKEELFMTKSENEVECRK